MLLDWPNLCGQFCTGCIYILNCYVYEMYCDHSGTSTRLQMLGEGILYVGPSNSHAHEIRIKFQMLKVINIKLCLKASTQHNLLCME